MPGYKVSPDWKFIEVDGQTRHFLSLQEEDAIEVHVVFAEGSSASTFRACWQPISEETLQPTHVVLGDVATRLEAMVIAEEFANATGWANESN